ncbi:reticulophagy regulator 2 isoform X2 [Pristis pectinata]|uniref:reticulophagy regulator 2 isoform X2 n=1 Tax=Pristis pectinata TaxID=685728 RepID=UPI00223D5988|nr:reticulophagy regulator 2 isoform X2 [Pristis pectinata]
MAAAEGERPGPGGEAAAAPAPAPSPGGEAAAPAPGLGGEAAPAPGPGPGGEAAAPAPGPGPGGEAAAPAPGPGPGGEAALGPEDSGDLQRTEEGLRRLLAQCEPGLLLLQSLLVWERPAHSVLMLLGLSGVFWLFSSTSLRPIFLISSSLLGIVLLDHWKSGLLAHLIVQHPMDEDGSDGNSTRPRLLRLPDLCHYLAESWVAFNLYLKEVLEYKRQNPGKFFLKMCMGCSALAAIGHYIPGIMISYIFILSLLLWPLVVYHELIQKMYTGLEPVLMKLDYSMKGSTQHRQRDRKKKLMLKPESCDEPTAETESESEAELSCFNSKVDVRTTALAFAITDSELSDEEASILESGGFTVSRGTTPQLSDVSEDLEQQSLHSEPEEAFARDLPEFPSVEELSGDGSPAHILPRLTSESDVSTRDSQFFAETLTSPLHFVNTHFNGNEAARSQAKTGQAPSLSSSLQSFSEEMVASAITTVVRNTLSSLLSNPLTDSHTESSEFLPAELDQNFQTTSELGLSEVEPHQEEVDDFELLDQGELDQMDTELGLTQHLRESSTLQGTAPEVQKES